jgi:hypothetical protein
MDCFKLFLKLSASLYASSCNLRFSIEASFKLLAAKAEFYPFCTSDFAPACAGPSTPAIAES